MKEAFELLDDVVLKAFELVADGWNNFNGVDGFAEFCSSLSHVRMPEEEIWDYAMAMCDPHWDANGHHAVVRPNIPEDHPVQPLTEEEASKAKDPVRCGTCLHFWDDAIPTSMTPAPAARCPFEAFHYVEYGGIRDDWIENLHSQWFSNGDRFWSVFKRLDPDNKKAFLTWLAMKQAQREHA